MNPVSPVIFTTSATVLWGTRGLMMGREVINVLRNAIGFDQISEKMPFLKTTLKVAACLLIGCGLIAIYKRMSCHRTENLASETGDSLDSPAVSLKKTVSPLELKQSIKEMPLMGFGTFIGIEYQKIADLEERRKIVEQSIFYALQAGCRHLDCASNYQNLEWVGNALRKAFLPEEEGGLGLKREEIWITSKDANPNAENLGSTLKALGLDYLDLYLMHYPHKSIQGIWKEMNALVEQGLVRNIGVSNFYHAQMQQLIQICEEEGLRLPYANEMEISPWVQENQFHDYCKKLGIRLIAYSPLGYGNSAALLETEQVAEKAKKLQATAAQVALAWNMARGIAVIPSSRNKEHIESNCSAVDFVETLAIDQEFMQGMQQADMNLCSTTTADHFKQQSLQFEAD